MAASRLIAGWLLSVCLAPAQLGWFHHDRNRKKQASEEGFVGIVSSKGLLAFTITAADTRVITFTITDSTIYLHDTKRASPYEISRGEAVKVEATADRDGNLSATNVTSQDDTPELKRRAQASELLPGGVTDDP